jgi:DNA-binding transcriptional regulator LsrR (DeoR family)
LTRLAVKRFMQPQSMEGARRPMRDELVQAAWLYHIGGLSQEDVSKRLSVSRFKVLRMLAEAREAGIVRIQIVHETQAGRLLADRIAARFGLIEVQVAPLTGVDDAVARRGVGQLAAGYLERIGQADAHGPKIIGVGWGRTVAAMADALTGLKNPELCFVSLMGSMTRTSETSPFDVCARLAAETGGSAVFLPAPFIADSAADADIIMRQRLVREALGVAREASHAIVSLGEGTPDALLRASGILTDAEIDELAKADVVADTTGKFLRADGSLANTELNARAPSVGLEDLRRCDLTLLAAGRAKCRATLAVLRSGIVDRLIVDAALAEDIVALTETRDTEGERA